MHRFRDRRDACAVRSVLDALPRPIRDRFRAVRIVSGYDPAYLGIHALGVASDGRAYATTSHCAWPHNLMHRPADDRTTTVFLAGEDARNPLIVLHELGHALDWALGWYAKPVRPLDGYAARTRREAFATAFQAWATPAPLAHGQHFHDREALRRHDPATAAFFRRISLGT